MPTIPKPFQSIVVSIVAIAGVVGTTWGGINFIDSRAQAAVQNAIVPIQLQVSSAKQNADKALSDQDAMFIRIDGKLDKLNEKIDRLGLKVAGMKGR